MKKEDLKVGNVVENKRGDRYLSFSLDNEKLINLQGFGYVKLNDYDDNLKCQYSALPKLNLDIVKVYEDYTCKKVLWKRKEKPVLTDDEKVILRNIDKAFRYIARDKDGDLYIYIEKTTKSKACHWNPTGCRCFVAYNHLFQFIKWEDEEPYSIEDLLNE